MSFVAGWLAATWLLLVESAPWLLLGFLVAGLLHTLLPEKFIERHLQRPGILSVLKASAIGVPLPLCSCSVIPIGVSLRRSGASRGAVASFFVSTPEIGVDSFLLSWVLLGPELAVIRVLAAFTSALLAGTLIDRFAAASGGRPDEAQRRGSSECCDAKPGSGQRRSMAAALRYGFREIVDDIAPSFTLGILLAGLLSAVVPEDLFFSSGWSPHMMMLLMLLVSVPLYICATASTPLAAVLLAKGAAPGPVIVFLLAGPATNVSTIAVLQRELGRRGVALYLLSIAGAAVGTSYLLSHRSVRVPLQEAAVAHEHASAIGVLAAILLVALLLHSIWRSGRSRCCR